MTIDFSLRCLIVISNLSVHDTSSTSFSFVAEEVAIEGSGRMQSNMTCSTKDLEEIKVL
jgi:hypothetical protein